eukprot:gb/GEZN01006899.1/.p1 GENE.gb/GEZN01006899.1/~~gb/GEZN01006899.1/.p1  ORF type:complete len:387 (-),score=76.16 gb/GEZN01006899.1/:445-1506(-)
MSLSEGGVVSGVEETVEADERAGQDEEEEVEEEEVEEEVEEAEEDVQEAPDEALLLASMAQVVTHKKVKVDPVSQLQAAVAAAKCSNSQSTKRSSSERPSIPLERSSIPLERSSIPLVVRTTPPHPTILRRRQDTASPSSAQLKLHFFTDAIDPKMPQLIRVPSNSNTNISNCNSSSRSNSSSFDEEAFSTPRKVYHDTFSLSLPSITEVSVLGKRSRDDKSEEDSKKWTPARSSSNSLDIPKGEHGTPMTDQKAAANSRLPDLFNTLAQAKAVRKRLRENTPLALRDSSKKLRIMPTSANRLKGFNQRLETRPSQVSLETSSCFSPSQHILALGGIARDPLHRQADLVLKSH